MRTLTPPRRVALPLAALAVLGTGWAAYGATTDSAPSYRTAVARVADVEQVLDLSGTIEPSGRSDLAFGTDGRVAAVRTAVGRSVQQGDVVAVLDRTSLRAAVDRATADLAAAKARLAEDRGAQTSAVADTGTGTDTGTGASSKGTKGSGTPSPSPAMAQLAAQQDAVLAAQTAASTALATSAAALATQQEACAAPDSPDGPDATETPEATGTPESPVSDACAAALAAVQSAQADTAEAQKSLQTALLALGKTLATAAATPATPTTPATPAASKTTPTPSTPTRTVTAATLADDQASIDRSRADLAQTRADLRAAVVRAPADGTVTALGVASGDQVSAGDTVATVVAPGVTTVTLEVGKDQAAQLATGTPVAVTPAGAADPLDGTISRVAHLPTATDDSATGGTSDPAYAVQVTLDQRDLALPDGLPASVAVVVGRADDAVTVPASALSDGTVQVLRDGRAERVPVTTGVVGSTEVEVVDGLDSGTRVVLADLDADVPSGDTQQGGSGGPGGFGGGGIRISGPGGSLGPAR